MVPVPVTAFMCLCTIKGTLHSRRAGHDGRTKNSEYDQEIPQSQTTDNLVAPRGRAA